MSSDDTGCRVIEVKSGADERSRTSDLLITNQLLYQLSYVGQQRAVYGKRDALSTLATHCMQHLHTGFDA